MQNGRGHTHNLSFFEPVGYKFSEHIINGVKTVEGRKAKIPYIKIKPGDNIKFNIIEGKNKGKWICCGVTKINKYENIYDYLITESVDSTVPDANDINEAVNVYKKHYNVTVNEPFLGIHIKFISHNLYPHIVNFKK